MTLLILVMLLQAAPLQTAQAAAGELDLAFNYGLGKGANGAVYSLARQSDGKIVIAGSFSAYNGDANDPALQPDTAVLAAGLFSAYNTDTSAPDNILRLVGHSSGPSILV